MHIHVHQLRVEFDVNHRERMALRRQSSRIRMLDHHRE
jgi:hypothetical protein